MSHMLHTAAMHALDGCIESIGQEGDLVQVT